MIQLFAIITAILLTTDRIACGPDEWPLAAGLIIAMTTGFSIAGAVL